MTIAAHKARLNAIVDYVKNLTEPGVRVTRSFALFSSALESEVEAFYAHTKNDLVGVGFSQVDVGTFLMSLPNNYKLQIKLGRNYREVVCLAEISDR